MKSNIRYVHFLNAYFSVLIEICYSAPVSFHDTFLQFYFKYLAPGSASVQFEKP